ncbi:phosphate/phosphite/phosphonate ABC transporter substrate-binding protein [Phormidium tenue FACHB-886]|nr:phosphate/phosphite/phosphonate ABC transporter substrate-binding protein [Phormidium tenue FACHB-886]
MMPRQSLAPLVLIASLIFPVSCSSSPEVSTGFTASDKEAIVLTDVDFDPDSLVPETQPVADYLGKNLGAAGITTGKVEIAPDSETAAEWLASGKTDLYFDSVYPIMKVMERSGGTPILRRWKDGVSEYNTLFVARRDSGITALADLKGKMIALEDPDSSSGFMFPMVEMLSANMKPVKKAEPNHPVAEDEVGYIFSGEDETTAEWILDGKVAVGTVDNEAFKEIPEAEREQLVVIAETDFYPRQVVLAAPDITPEQANAIKAVMLAMDESEKGQAALAEFSETAQFDEFPDGALSRLQDQYETLQNYLQK